MTLLVFPNAATDIAVTAPGHIGAGTLAHRRDFDRRESGRFDTERKPIYVSVLVTKCTRADAVDVSYGWTASLGAILCPDCFPGGAA